MAVSTAKGRIARLEYDRGFGFITPDGERSVDHFFNIRGMHPLSRSFHALKEGDRVSFVAVMNDKGPRAIEVRAE